MGWSLFNKFKSVSVGGKRGGGYNITTGAISHPTKGSGLKSPKVKGKSSISKTPKKK